VRKTSRAEHCGEWIQFEGENISRVFDGGFGASLQNDGLIERLLCLVLFFNLLGLL
jgi:hypothetical protein